MSAHFQYKAGDTAPAFRIQLLTMVGLPQDLTGATARLLVKKPSGKKLASALTVEVGAEGWVNRSWATGDLDESGIYAAECEVTFSGGAIQTYPAHGHIRLIVTEQLD